MEQRTFKVKYEPDGSGWHAWIPEIPGCRTWGKTLASARENMREALSCCTDVLGPNADEIAKHAKLEFFNEN